MKDKEFFNSESQKYSSKRYPEKAVTYIQYFFKKRLAFAIRELSKAFAGKSRQSLLEVGTADGIVIREIAAKIPGVFSSFVGTDTAEDMIAAARNLTTVPGATFFVRGQEPLAAVQPKKFDAILEIGVANYTDFDQEIAEAKSRLNPNGVFVLSIAGNSSLHAKRKIDHGYQNFLSYKEYEDKIKTAFTIEKAIPVGLELPFIWRWPAYARIKQPATDAFFRHLAPSLFHEKLYILRPKA